MRTKAFTLISLLCLLAAGLSHGAVLVQQNTGNLAFEAEHYDSLSGTGWKTITSSSGVKLLPSGSNAVGGALYGDSGTLQSFATYNLQFTSDGTYYLYLRYSMYDITNPNDGTAPSYGNEDSFLVAGTFNQNIGTGSENVQWFAQHLNAQGRTPPSHANPNPNEGMYFTGRK